MSTHILIWMEHTWLRIGTCPFSLSAGLGLVSLRPSNKIPGTYAIRAGSQVFKSFSFHQVTYHRYYTIYRADSDVKQTTRSIYNPLSRCKNRHVTVQRLRLAEPARCSCYVRFQRLTHSHVFPQYFLMVSLRPVSKC
jgi:hypothetical protein